MTLTPTLRTTTPTPHRARRKSWSIQIDKEYHKFSAAHFLIFDDGSAERLHGHNYRVAVELASAKTEHGMVLDFQAVKPLITAIVEQLDERFLLPGTHPDLRIRELPSDTGNDAPDVEVRFARRRYLAPADEVFVLPIDNTSSERLAEWIANSLATAIALCFPDAKLDRLSVSVEETAGQRGRFLIDY